MTMRNKLLAEFIGTFWLVFGGCGSALFAAAFKNDIGINIGLVGVSFAFGLTVLTMAYAVGHISGGHFNPAVSLGLAVGGRFKMSELVPYWVAQVIGGLVAAAALAAVVQGNGTAITTLASNGFGADGSPGGYGLGAVFLMEALMTGAFLFIIMGSTDKRAPAGFAPIAIGLGLTLIHLISIPVSNTSVNPARSTGPALISMAFGGEGSGLAVSQLWMFWVAPLVGAVAGAILYNMTIAGADD